MLMIVHVIFLILIALFTVTAGFIISLCDIESRILVIPWRISLGLMIGLCAFLIVGYACANQAPSIVDDEPYETEYIVALNDNNLIAGRSYVQRGHVDESLHYQYMVQLEDGSLKAAEVPADNTTLFYTTENYRVEKYHETKKWLYFETQSTQIKIYIPKDAVLEQFGVQLE